MLKLCDIKDTSQSVWLVAPKVTIGRASGCDLTISDESVAKLHAEISVDGDELVLRNLAGEGQLLVNGNPVDEYCAVRHNDRVQIGARQLVVVDPKISRIKAAGSATNVAWALRANHPAIVGRVFPVRENSVVGRSEECDLTFAMSHLSRRHARLEIREGLLFVIDLGSANGTYLNNQKVAESRVRRGDELRFDSLSFSVVGPADDLGKTTVRQAISMPEFKQPVAEDGAELPRKQASARFALSAENQPSAYRNDSTMADGSNGWLWLGVIFVAVATGAYFWALSQGLL